MLDVATLKNIGERALNSGLVVLVGVLVGNSADLFSLDWWQVGSAVLGAAVLETARGLITATATGEPSTTALVRRLFRRPAKK